VVEEHVQRYTTLETVLDVRGLQVCVTRIAHFEELLEALDPITFAEDERLPYWAELWPAAVAMAHYMTERLPLAGRHVLELGCGLGLVGIVAALQGARVLSTDYEATALAFARHNARRNGCQRARFRLMDWRYPTLRRRYDYILAADVIYEARNFGPLVAVLRRYLARGGTAVFSEPGRVNAVPFFALVRQHGFTYETEPWPLEWEGSHQIALHTIRYQGRSSLRSSSTSLS
jgi:predicted nicotinamide N-methyase